ncbi:MAG: hypothetical protein K2K46_10660 [Lachnospiraceae bacterium]|nr:hypothetical protein [Lachnospiraceae bacterium]
MQKTKLGITVGALGAITYFAGFFSGYLVAIILAGYVLLFEENAWLKRSAVKAIVLMTFFSVLVALINFIPDVIGFIGNIVSVFNGHFAIVKVSQIITVLVSGINIVEKILFLGLGIRALSQGTIVIPYMDAKVSKYVD